MAHLKLRSQTPPPMSPATTNAHNFYNTFASRRGNASPPPSMYHNPSQPTVGMAPPRPSSAMPQQGAGGGFYQPSNYVNAQYYRDERQNSVGMNQYYPGSPGLGPQAPQSPGLQTGFNSLNVGPSRQRTPPPPPSG